jgi:hypothetical protein
MSLEMRGSCERCGNPTPPDGETFICSYECTFCPACSADVAARCPNCDGELVRRPLRRPAAT